VIERTSAKQLLGKSLLQLAEVRPLRRITVADIARNCSVARETFYYHFSNKEELAYWVFRNETDRYVAEGRFNEPIIDVWAKCLETLRSHERFYRELFKDQIVLRLVKESFIHWVTDCVSQQSPEYLADEDIVFAIDFYAAGLLEVTVDWLNDARGRDAHEASRRMCAIMPQALKRFYIF
jgi:AcrR family transcriptional regulator